MSDLEGLIGTQSTTVTLNSEPPELRAARVQQMAADAEHRRRLEWLVNVLVGFLVMFILVASLAVAFGFLPGTERTQGYAYNILSSVGAGCAVFLLGKKRRD